MSAERLACQPVGQRRPESTQQPRLERQFWIMLSPPAPTVVVSLPIVLCFLQGILLCNFGALKCNCKTYLYLFGVLPTVKLRLLFEGFPPLSIQSLESRAIAASAEANISHAREGSALEDIKNNTSDCSGLADLGRRFDHPFGWKRG